MYWPKRPSRISNCPFPFGWYSKRARSVYWTLYEFPSSSRSSIRLLMGKPKIGNPPFACQNEANPPSMRNPLSGCRIGESSAASTLLTFVSGAAIAARLARPAKRIRPVRVTLRVMRSFIFVLLYVPHIEDTHSGVICEAQICATPSKP